MTEGTPLHARRSRRGNRVRWTLAVLAGIAASGPGAFGDDKPAPAGAPAPAPAPAPPAVPVAPAPAEKPPEPPPTEFIGADAIRRPDGLTVHYYRVNYVAPDVLAKELEIWKTEKTQFLPAGPNFVAAKTAVGSVSSNMLRIVDTDEHWPVIQGVLAMLDVPQPQVRVEAKVLELTWDDQLKLGMTAKVARPLGDTFLQSAEAKFPNPLDAVNGFAAAFRSVDKYIVFDYAFQAAEQGAKAEVLSQPSVLASQGETAMIRAGDDEPFVVQSFAGNAVSTQTQFKPTGVTLEVTPLLVGRDAVRVRITAEASRVSDFRVTATTATQQVVNAVISTRNANTTVTIPDGETLVIGGLQVTAKRETKTGIPLLMDIPVLGYLFGSTSDRDQKTELFFWIKLTIERPEEARLFVPPSEKRRVAGDGSGAPSGQ